MCFDLSWNTGFSMSFMQLWLSQCTTVGSSFVLNKSEGSFLSHTASLQAALAAIYSASAVLWAMEPCFLLDQDCNNIRKYSSGPQHWTCETIGPYTSLWGVSETISQNVFHISCLWMFSVHIWPDWEHLPYIKCLFSYIRDKSLIWACGLIS